MARHRCNTASWRHHSKACTGLRRCCVKHRRNLPACWRRCVMALDKSHDDWLGLAGRVCVVTGAASGIGAAVAAAAAHAGALLALLDKDAEGCADMASKLAQQGFPVIA